MDIQSNSTNTQSDHSLNFETFQENFPAKRFFAHFEGFLENKGMIQIKKEKTVIKNLARIFEATFRICSRKGYRGMSMRDLSQESGLSMGGLYAYFRSKDELFNTLQRVGNRFVQRILIGSCQQQESTYLTMRTLIKTHLYLSEIVQAWFFFSYMEAKSMNKQERDFYKDSELYTEGLIHETLIKGAEEGIFQNRDHLLAASVIKAMLQDWYLKRWKYSKREIHVDQYADFVLDFIESYYLIQKAEPESSSNQLSPSSLSTINTES